MGFTDTASLAKWFRSRQVAGDDMPTIVPVLKKHGVRDCGDGVELGNLPTDALLEIRDAAESRESDLQVADRARRG